ncbi:hypothetical protein D1BOALGB6SA_1514 [Olavius sp. associated proteobacterium Delta 1]|nr:hypothetical protein D1BOALGB6SA_1514 [Olavius sp. associated proteobacterium Delta 1]
MKPEKQNVAASTHPKVNDKKNSDLDESANDAEKRLQTAKPEFGSAAAETRGAGAVGGKTLDIVSEEEIRALVQYVTERGLDPDGSVVGDVVNALYSRQVQSNDVTQQIKVQREIIQNYNRLSALTYPAKQVSGRSIVDTPRIIRSVWPILMTGLALIVAVIALEYFSGQKPPEGSKAIPWMTALSALVLPFLWGALGSAVYLMKRVSDVAEEFAFDSRRFRGWFSRMLLGATLGAVVVLAFLGSEGFQPGNLKPAAIAFLSGLGVRAIYSSFEALVNIISRRVQMASQSGGPEIKEQHAFIEKEIKIASDAKDTERVRSLMAVKGALGKRSA